MQATADRYAAVEAQRWTPYRRPSGQGACLPVILKCPVVSFLDREKAPRRTKAATMRVTEKAPKETERITLCDINRLSTRSDDSIVCTQSMILVERSPMTPTKTSASVENQKR